MATLNTGLAQEIDPLLLVPDTNVESASSEPIGLHIGVARDQFVARSGRTLPVEFDHRITLEFQHEWSVTKNLRLGISDRLEGYFGPTTEARNALRESYASLAFGDDKFVDIGRINWRQGVGIGFNPTDFLRRGSKIAQTTQNPATLSNNRLGTVMLRGQVLSIYGSIQVAAIPALADAPATSTTSLALGNTNPKQAVLAKVTPSLGERATIDVLAYSHEDEHLSLGGNGTLLISDAWVAYFEWMGRRALPLAGPGEKARKEIWTNTLVAGLTWTSPAGIVVSIERHYAEDALTPDRAIAWERALAGPQRAIFGAAYGAIRASRANAQSPLTRDAWFSRLSWNNAFGQRDVDLSMLGRLNSADNSLLLQATADWHINSWSSLQVLLGKYIGSSTSEYGSSATSLYGQAGFLFHF